MNSIFKKIAFLSLMMFSSLIWAQAPANDDCSAATDIGSLPTPGACSGGLEDGATVTLNGQTTVNATGANPYTYLTNCTGGGDMASPALDTWYQFTATGTSLNFSIAGFPNASVGIWSGTCAAPVGIACLNVDGTGNGSLTVPTINVGTTYYLQISGNNATDTDNNFSITLDNDIDCDDCLRSSTLVASPAPTNGAYLPGTVVTYCYTVTAWEQTNTNWFHGVQITMGPGWTGAITGATPAATCQTDLFGNPTGNWLFYPGGPGMNNGVNWGPGFYFDTADGGTDPRNNFGDDCDGTGLSWQFCFDLTVSSTCVGGENLSVTVGTSGDGESGSWTSVACQTDADNSLTAVKPYSAVVTNPITKTICDGDNVNLPLTADVPATFEWIATANPNVTGETTTTQTTSTITDVLVNTTTVVQTVIYTVTPIATSTGCPGLPETVTITVEPTNTITLTSAAGTDNQTVCVNTAITDITYATTQATGATITGLPAGVTGSWAGNVVTITGTPTTAVGSPFNYTVTLTGGCGTVSANGTITVTPDNTIALTSAAGTDNQTLCINTAITDITYATTGATGATITGLPAGVTGSWAGNVVTITGTPTTTVGSPFNYTVTLTGGCGVATANGTITVTPDNTIALTSAAGTDNQTLCVNTAITNITYATTGATGATITGLPAGVTGSWAGNVVTITGTPTTAVGSPFNYTVTLTGGCGTVSANGTITVTPDNTIALTSAAGTDNQSVCVNTAITDIIYATTGATGATITGLPAGVTGSWAGNVVTITGTPTTTVGSPFNYTVTLTGGCGTVSANGTISVVTVNTIALTSAAGTDNQTLCINTAITDITYATTGATGATITGLPAGVTGSWAGNVVTITGTPTTTVGSPFNYTVTLTGGCGTVSTNGTITVTPDNTIALTSAVGTDNQTLCINTAITNITYATTGATGATITGLPAGVTGSWAGNVVTITGTPTTAVGSPFNYTVTLTGGCGVATANGTITVTPDNTIALTSAAGTDNQSICVNTAITDITYATTGATGATITGLPAGVTGSWAGNVVTITGTPTTTVGSPFNYTVTLTGGCGTISTNGTITVTPDNTIALTSAAGTDNQSICVNTALTDITYATTGATGATITGLPAGVTGSWAGNVVTITGTPTTAVGSPFNYTVTLTGGCGTISTNGTISVVTANTIALTSAAGTDNQTLCVNTAITDITYATTGATGATITGLPAGVTGSWAGNVVTITGTPTTTVGSPFNYTVTLTGGCGVATANGTITVTPDNTIALTSAAGTDNQTLCINTAITDITYATTGATGATITGLPAGVTGSWAGNVVTITGTPTTTVGSPFNYTVTLTGGCGVATANGTITVTPDNTIALTSAAGTDNQSICVNTAITDITYATTGATGATITGLPAGVTGSWAGNVVTITGTPTTAVGSPFNYTVTLTGGCGVATANGTITVTPDNTIALTSAAGTDNQTLCINTAITDITYATTGATGATITGLPAGVTGSWAGNVVTITGTPTTTVGSPFNYTVTLTGGCGVVTANGTITVTPDNTIALTSAAGTDNQSICVNTAITDITYATTGATGATITGLPAGVTGSWAGNVVTITGTPTTTVGSPFNYTVTLTGGCGVATANGTISVVTANTIALTSAVGTDNQTLCINTAITDITYATTGATGATITGLPAGVTGSWAGNVVTITGTPTTTVGSPFNYTVTLTGGCGVATANGTITVTPDNTIALTSAAGTDNQTLCINTAITDITYATTGATGATITGLPAGVTGSWAGNVVTITGTPTTTVGSPFNYTVTLTGGCGVATANGTITVTPDNTIALTSAAGTDNQTLCINTAITDITYATTGATGATITGLPAGVTGSWAGNVVTITGTPTTTVGSPFNYTVTLTGGCGTVSANGTITVTPDNTIALTSAAGTDNQTLCINTAITDITYATTGATGATITGLPAGVTGSWAGNVVTITGTPTTTVGSPFNYTVTLTGGCGVATANGTITVTPDNTIALTSAAGTDNQSICVNTAITDITYATTGATGATITGLPAGVTGSWASNVVTITGTPTTAVGSPFNYTVTLTGGCGVATANGTISVVTVNTIALTSAAGTDNQTLCINTAITDITYATTGATGATITGLPAGVTGSWAGNVVTITGTPTTTVGSPFNYTVTLTGGCGTVSANGTITVTPDNTIALTSAAGTDNQTLCINTAITDITYATTGATGATITGLPAGVTGSWAGNVVTITGTPTTTVGSPFNYTVTLTGGCGLATANGTITVTPDNTIALTSAAGTDNQTLCINTAITDITYATTGATGATITGLPAGVTGSWAGNVVTITGTPTTTVGSPFNYTVTLTGGCGVATANGTITVTPDNTIALTSAVGTDNQTLCINTAITDITYATTGATGATITGLPAGVTGSWAGNVVTITGTPTTTVGSPFNYTVTLTGGCGTISTNGTITVTPDNTIALTSAAGTDNQSLCINTAITDITYATTGATGATITGLPAGVTGSWAGDVVTITGTPTTTVGSPFNYTVTLTGGCGVATANGTITVTPDSTIALTSAAGTDNQTLCINTALTDITYATTGATGATITGLPAGVTGSWAGNVVTITGTPTTTVGSPFNYTVTLTGGCGVVFANGTITVNPDNTITLTSAAGTDNQTVCADTAITDITYATTSATGATITGLPAGVTGSWAGNVVTITGTPTTTVGSPFNYTITLTGGCGVATANGTITVNENPIANAINDLEECDVDSNGNPDNDGVVIFDLTTHSGVLLNGQSGMNVTYHLSQVEADANVNSITSQGLDVTAYANTSNPQTIVVRVENGTTGCYDTTQFELRVNSLNAVTPTALYACDDDNDTFGWFNLEDATAEIQNGNTNLIVTYYETEIQSEAGAGANIDTTGLYQNIDTDGDGFGISQVVYIRVDDPTTGCFYYSSAFTLTLNVLESPELPSSEIVYNLCEDNGSNDGYVEFDLMDYALNTLGLDPALIIEFYTGLDASGNPIGFIPNFNNYTNVTTPDQVIYLVVSNANTDSNGDACTIIRSMTLHVDLLPNVPEFHDIFECDDDYFDEADGIYPFNLSAEVDVITGGVTGLVVEFYEELADAQAGSGPSLITNPSEFLNTAGPGGDDVFARVYDASTGCYAITHIKLHVDANPTPLSNQEIIDQLGNDGVMEECDGNVDGSGSIAEQVAEFDLTSWETLILTGTGSGIETGVSASYYTSYDDADGATNAIGTPNAYTNTSNPQTIYVRVTSDGTGIIPQTSGTGCYTIVQFDIFVPVPDVSVSGDTVLCVDENGVPLSGAALPVLTASPSTGGYEYQWALNGVDIPGAINETHTATEAGVYTVTVSGPMDYDCVNSASITVEESGMPSGYDANVTTTAFADNHQIQATATSNIPGVVFYYTLDLDATTGIGVETNTTGLFTDVGPGLHYITITDGKACWSDVVEVLVIDYPHFFTPNGDGVNDTWQIIGVEGIPISIIYIFDRYGKLLKQLDPDGAGWDGNYNGHAMPAGDYWFTIDYIEGEITPTQKEFKAHFSIKR